MAIDWNPEVSLQIPVGGRLSKRSRRLPACYRHPRHQPPPEPEFTGSRITCGVEICAHRGGERQGARDAEITITRG